MTTDDNNCCVACRFPAEIHDDGVCPVECEQCDGAGVLRYDPWEPVSCMFCGGAGILLGRKDPIMPFQIETIDHFGNWSADPIGPKSENQFTSETEAEEMITQLRAIDEEWANADYRVVNIES